MDIFHAMYQEARRGNVQAARLLFEAAGVMSETQETGPVDRRVQFIIVAPGASLGLPTVDDDALAEPGAQKHDGHHEVCRHLVRRHAQRIRIPGRLHPNRDADSGCEGAGIDRSVQWSVPLHIHANSRTRTWGYGRLAVLSLEAMPVAPAG